MSLLQHSLLLEGSLLALRLCLVPLKPVIHIMVRLQATLVMAVCIALAYCSTCSAERPAFFLERDRIITLRRCLCLDRSVKPELHQHVYASAACHWIQCIDLLQPWQAILVCH